MNTLKAIESVRMCTKHAKRRSKWGKNGPWSDAVGKKIYIPASQGCSPNIRRMFTHHSQGANPTIQRTVPSHPQDSHPPSYSPNRFSNNRDIPVMDKCRHGKCHCDCWNLFQRLTGTFVLSLVKAGSATAEILLPKGSLKKKKPEIYWSFTNTGGGSTPRPIYFRFFPEEKTFIA